jgi:polyisoprenoid-binding protein YceI
MAKISEYESAGSVLGNELIPCVQGGVNRNITPAQLIGGYEIKNILQQITVGSSDGADYTSLNAAIAAIGTITTFRIVTAITLTANITFPAGVTLIMGAQGSLAGAYTITGNNTTIKFEGFNAAFNTNVLWAGTWNIERVYPEYFGAVGDDVTDDGAAFTKAIALAKLTKTKILAYCNKKYFLQSNTATDHSNVLVEGNHATLRKTNGGFYSVAGTVGTFYALDETAHIYDSWVICTNPTLLSTLEPGDIVKIISDEICLPASGESVRIGEMHQIRTIEASTGVIFFNEYINWSYTLANNVRMARVELVDLTIRDIKCWIDDDRIDSIIDVASAGVQCSYARVHLENVSLKANTFGVLLNDCWRPFIRAKLFQTDRDGYGYGVCPSNATMYADISFVAIGGRHNFTTGGSGSSFGADLGGVSWHNNVHDCIATAAKSANAMYDTHASSGRTFFDNCIAIGGIYREYVDDIADWDSSTNYSIGEFTRATTERLYKALTNNINQDPLTNADDWVADPGNGQSGFKAEGLYEHYRNCVTIGCQNGVQVYGLGVKEIIVDNLNCYEAQYGALSRYVTIVEKLKINGLHIHNNHLHGVAVVLSGMFSSYSFDDISIDKGNILTITKNSTSGYVGPEELTLNNCRAIATPGSTSYAVVLNDQTIKKVHLRNFYVENQSLYSTTNDNGEDPTPLLRFTACEVKAPSANVLNIQHRVASLMINGLSIIDPTSAIYAIYIRYAVTTLSLNGVYFGGTYATLFLYTYSTATLSRIIHMNNIMPNLTTFRTGTGAVAALEVLGGGEYSGFIMRGPGDPEGAITAPIGSIYLQTNGDSATGVMHVKESGAGNTGWEAK